MAKGTELRLKTLALASFGMVAASPALAHPHVFVTAKAELVFNAAGEVAAVRNIWQFDEAFSAFAVQGLDTNNDGALTAAELAPLAQVNMDSLAEYGFFTWVSNNGAAAAFAAPQDYWLDIYSARLTLFFTLPLETPFRPTGEATVDVYDPEYYVAFDFTPETPFALVDAPAACAFQYRPPGELDTDTVVALAAIPADQMVPENLLPLTSILAHHFAVSCP
ncbi:MAG: DUF1007 family protein [Bauldia sp.]